MAGQGGQKGRLRRQQPWKPFCDFWCRCACGTHPYPSRTRWLSRRRPMVLCRRRHGRAGGCQIYGGIAQLGEHLPCKQGVRSSNLLISIRWSQTAGRRSQAAGGKYLENCTLRKTSNIEKRRKSGEIRDFNFIGREAVREGGGPIQREPIFIQEPLPHRKGCGQKVKQRRAQGGCLGTKSR